MIDTLQKLKWEINEALIEHRKQGAPTIVIEQLLKARGAIYDAWAILVVEP